MEENGFSGTDPCHLYYGCFRKIYLERNPDTGTGKIEVPVLDATAIGVSMLRGDYGTAGSVMFLLGVGELLEEWTHKKIRRRSGTQHVAERRRKRYG